MFSRAPSLADGSDGDKCRASRPGERSAVASRANMRGEWRIGARLALLGGIAAVILAAGGVLLYFERDYSLVRAQVQASRIFSERAANAGQEIDDLLDRAVALASLAPNEKSVGDKVRDNGLDHPALDLLVAVAKSAPSIYAAYYGLADGGFLEVIATHGDPDVIKALDAPAGTDRVVRTVVAEDGTEVTQYWTFLDAAGMVLNQRSEANPKFDPRKTAWYQRGADQEGPVLTRPYMFSSIPVVGITAVTQLPPNRGVFGVDFTLSNLGRFIAEHPISANGALYIFDNSLDLLAAAPEGPYSVPTDKLMSDMRTLGIPVLQMLAELSQAANINQATAVPIQGRDYIALVSRWHGHAAPMIDVGIVAPVSDFTVGTAPLFVLTSFATAVLLIAALALAAWFTRRSSTPR